MLKNLLERTKSIINKRGYKVFLPLLYIFGLLFGLFLMFVSPLIQSPEVCSTLFGVEFCTPLGLYIASILSVPGYFIAGNLFPFLKNIPWYSSLFIVFVITLTLYYSVGLLIDKLKSSKSKLNLVIILIFIFLIFLLAMFLVQTQSTP